MSGRSATTGCGCITSGVPTGPAEAVARGVRRLYEGYSRKPWARRSALMIGLCLAAYGLGSFMIGQAANGVLCLGLAAFWFLKMVMWSLVKSGGRPPTL